MNWNRFQTVSFLTLISIALVTVPTISTAQVYKWVDENGKVHYSDKKPPASENKAVEVVDESILNDDANILDSTDDGVDPDRLRADRLRREQNREDEENQAREQQAKSFQAKNCYTRTEEIRRGNAGGGTRVVGTQEVKRCRQPIPNHLQPYLEDFTYEGTN